jgi:hypothetical protein
VFLLFYCHTVATGTVEELAMVGRLEVDSEIVPISAVHALLEVLSPLKIRTSVPSGPGAQP